MPFGRIPIRSPWSPPKPPAKNEASRTLQFDVHLPNLLREMVEGQTNPGPLTTALNLTFPILSELAKRAIELDDPKLNILMLRLALYEVDPAVRPTRIREQEDRL